MAYRGEERKWNPIWKVQEYEANDVWVAKGIPAGWRSAKALASLVPSGQGQVCRYYTALAIKKHETAKLLMEIWETGKKSGRNSQGWQAAGKDGFWVAYPFQKARPLEQFFPTKARSQEECQKICQSLLAACTSSKEPWPVLCLILKQRQIHMQKDGSIFLGYQIDLSQLNPEAGEQECAIKCAELILQLLQEQPGTYSAGKHLIEKKIQKEGYQDFPELLQDIHLDFPIQKKGKIKEKIENFFRKKRRGLIRLLLACSLCIGIAALLMLFSQITVGDVPLLRLFTSSFEKIGKESLIQ